MIKKFACFLIIAIMIFPLGGCWNYRGLNEMAIVIGIAIDKNTQNDNYHLSFEMVDTSSPIKEKGPSSKIIESEGKTLFDAARNAKKKTTNKLYYGHTQVVVLSEEVARNEDMSNIIDWLDRKSTRLNSSHT
jgi:spore germination protein KC